MGTEKSLKLHREKLIAEKVYGFMLESDDNLSGLAESNFDDNLDATDLALGCFESENKEIVDLG